MLTADNGISPPPLATVLRWTTRPSSSGSLPHEVKQAGLLSPQGQQLREEVRALDLFRLINDDIEAHDAAHVHHVRGDHDAGDSFTAACD